jgi:hypothetical protein
MNDFAGTDIARASMAGPMALVSAAEITRTERPAAGVAILAAATATLSRLVPLAEAERASTAALQA